MRVERKGPIKGRVEYRWPVDLDEGFEKSSLIYDDQGRLIAVDYEMNRHRRRADERKSPDAPRPNA